MADHRHCSMDGALVALDMLTQDNVEREEFDDERVLIDVADFLWN